jgi:predicted esterase
MRSWLARCATATAAGVALVATLLAVASFDAGARPRPPWLDAAASPHPHAAKTEEAPPPDEPPVTPITVKVPGDKPLSVVLGPPKSRLAVLYLHGVCGDPLAFTSWVRALASQATLISLRGDEKCDDRPGRTKWSWDLAGLDRRVTRALGAVNALHDTPLDGTNVVVVGYSQGATRAQALAWRFPKRYRRVALVAIATEPSRDALAQTERVLLVAGERDARKHIREGRDALAKAGKLVRYLELPEARHGEYGPKALEVMGAGMRWLFDGRQEDEPPAAK